MNYRWALGALALCACSAEVADTGDETTVGTVSDAVTRVEYTADVTTGHSQVVTNMASSSGNVCFLTRVSGKFYTASDSVTITKGASVWTLAVTSTASNGTVGATAVCVAGTDLGQSPLVQSSQGQQHTYNFSASLFNSGGACFLSHVAGHFGGSGDHVQVGWDGGSNWKLDVTQTSSGASEAKAQCIKYKTPITLDNGSTFGQWFAGNSGTLLYKDQAPLANPTVACYLFGMRGKFMGYGERVAASYQTSYQYHYLGGKQGDSGSGLAASGGCISVN
jgi:hypothetical protein